MAQYLANTEGRYFFKNPGGYVDATCEQDCCDTCFFVLELCDCSHEFENPPPAVIAMQCDSIPGAQIGQSVGFVWDEVPFIFLACYEIIEQVDDTHHPIYPGGAVYVDCDLCCATPCPTTCDEDCDDELTARFTIPDDWYSDPELCPECAGVEVELHFLRSEEPGEGCFWRLIDAPEGPCGDLEIVDGLIRPRDDIPIAGQPPGTCIWLMTLFVPGAACALDQDTNYAGWALAGISMCPHGISASGGVSGNGGFLCSTSQPDPSCIPFEMA